LRVRLKESKDVSSEIAEVSVQNTWDALAHDPEAVLIDVRTVPEWQFVGIPNLTPIGKNVVTVSWSHYPNQPNPSFVEDVLAAGVDPQQPVYLICRSGARSRSAAAALIQSGFGQCFNVTEGFEGGADGAGHRLGGWKGAGLPWNQS